jgi:hypothetical protein
MQRSRRDRRCRGGRAPDRAQLLWLRAAARSRRGARPDVTGSARRRSCGFDGPPRGGGRRPSELVVQTGSPNGCEVKATFMTPDRRTVLKRRATRGQSGSSFCRTPAIRFCWARAARCRPSDDARHRTTSRDPLAGRNAAQPAHRDPFGCLRVYAARAGVSCRGNVHHRCTDAPVRAAHPTGHRYGLQWRSRQPLCEGCRSRPGRRRSALSD